jgi:DNA invertase Pin-like site-specific DNA recombinase
MPIKIALYARISTHEGKQHLENQLAELRAYARKHEMPITHEYTDEESGAADNRPGLEEMMSDAARGKFDRLMVWDLSRLTRGGPAKAFELIGKLRKNKVEFWSLQEPLFRTGGEDGVGQVFVAIAAHVAREERQAARERIRAGIAQARKNGKAFGRPKTILDPARLLRYQSEGLSLREIAQLEHTDKSTVRRRLAELCPANRK